MDKMRRKVLRSFGGTAILAAGAVLLQPLEALAIDWKTAAYGAKNNADALKGLGYGDPASSADIVIKAPDIAENGSVVPLEVVSNIPGTEAIAIMVDKNPSPMVGEFIFSSHVDPYVSTRIKMGETSAVRVFVKAGGKTYTATREVKVTIGGCGG